jgi:hypothetical protein
VGFPTAINTEGNLMDELSAVEAAIWKKLTEAEARIYEAKRIWRHYVKQRELERYDLERSETIRSDRRCLTASAGEEDPRRVADSSADLRRRGLYPGQLDNLVDYDDDNQECLE